MKIVAATHCFEAWLAKAIDLVPEDLAFKHQQMKLDPFLFFRATFYRWCQVWREECPKLARAIPTRAVGDLHLENFGTWRDTEGRLIWGVNDFDEAHPMSFANDLVRLAVSAFLSAEAGTAFRMKSAAICGEIQAGYLDYMKKGGEPFVLMEKHPLLREMAIQDLRQPAPFWTAMAEKTTPIAGRKVPASVCAAIRGISPCADFEFYVVRTPKGLGSLGRERFLAIGDWEGGRFAREAKAVAPSGVLWAENRKASRGNPYLEKTVRSAVRCRDPFYEIRKGWLVRRLAPDCSRIDVAELNHHRDQALLLRCMGAETANVHLIGKKVRAGILKEFTRLPNRWLLKAAEKLHHRCMKDWEQFRDRWED